MLKKLIILLSILSLATVIGCTSSKKQDDEAGAELTDSLDSGTTTDENAAVSEDPTQAPAADSASNALTDDILGEEPKTAATDAMPTPEPMPTPDTSVGVDTAETPTSTTDNFFESSTPSTPPTAANETPPAPVDDTPKPPPAPLRKIEDKPFNRGGVLANAVYLARPGDTIASVSQKIYGSNKSAELKKANPSLKKKLRVGDKVYYNSPQRPTDDVKLLTFYEDQGIAPEIYVSQSGDNVRKVGKKLLGDSGSWKEIWATNMDLESKGELAPGTTLKYWKAETVAVATAKPVEEATQLPPLQEETLPPPPPVAPAQVQNVPPPTEQPLPPPPPPPQQAQADITPPPPPPPVPSKVEKKAKKAAIEEKNDDMMTYIAGGVIVLAALAGLVIMRRKSAARLAQQQMQMSDLEKTSLG